MGEGVRVVVVVMLFHLSHQKLPSHVGLNGLEDSPLTEVRAVEGGRVLLPCNMEPPLANDSTHLVLFYHGDVGTPIYSLDSRSVSLEQASHWADDDLGGRAYMRLEKSLRGLLLEEVQLKDEGEYRCRVDFLESPTRNLRVRLQVIVPPRTLAITTDHFREPSVKGLAGPFPEGAEVTLSCQVIGGHPRPQVAWWHEGSLLDDVSEVMTGQVTRNALSLPPLTRSDLNKTLTCQAANSDLTIPLSEAVTIDMKYPPTSVRLVAGSEGQVTLTEGVGRALTCEGRGARPPARLQWWKNGSPLGHTTMVEIEGEVSRSTLTLTPDSGDNGSLLTCRGFSPGLPDLVLENSTKITVLYKPQLVLQLDPHLDLEDVEEGDDVIFRCLVSANPAVTGVQWAHNGVPLQNNLTQGVHVSYDTLVLQGVTRAFTGTYTCAAANPEGARTSDALQIAVKFPPTCAEGQQTVYGAARHEQLHVPCHVQSYPEPISFRWAVNTSTGVVDVALNLSSSSGNKSTVRYTPQTHHDFGHLLCWAQNDIGSQQDPCVFHVIPAAKPESVTECRAERNATMPATYVVMTCLPGWDGGLNQTFTLEVRQAAKEEVLEAFRHAPDPLFIITGLKVGVEYLLTVTAANSRGSSPPLTITYTASAASADKVVSPHAHNALLSITPFLVLLVGVLVAVSACVGVGVILAKRQRRRKSGAKILYAGPLKDGQENHDVHTIVCVNRECEKEELMKNSVCGGTVGSFYVNPSTLLNNSGVAALETDVLLRERSAPLASVDSLGRCSTPSSICTNTSKTTSSRSSRASSSTVALNPDYLAKDPDFLVKTPEYLVAKDPDFFAKNPEYFVVKNPDYLMTKSPEYLLAKSPEYLVAKSPEYLVAKSPEYLAREDRFHEVSVGPVVHMHKESSV
ncbi:protein turtle homolog A-like [Homarus americanus]|uniref:protein turtle homolog A-like n=1 Tax=Homarus americanus TaxID=6706 RepID=UPI001C445B90|nr:protein turtle homolog A-like [Homarus americanus]